MVRALALNEPFFKPMSRIFTENLDIVFLVYGLSFLVLGFVVSIFPRSEQFPVVSKHVLWLASFGFLHGLQELIDGVNLYKNSRLLEMVALCLGSLSFLVLFEFGRRGFNGKAEGDGPLSALLAYSWVFLGFGASIFFSQNAMDGIAVGARYCLGAVGAALTAGLFYRPVLAVEGRAGARLPRAMQKLIAASFLVYAVLTCFVSAKSVGVLGWLPTTQGFYHSVGVPIQLFRAVCAFFAAIALFGLVILLNKEIQANLDQAIADNEDRATRIQQQQSILAEIARSSLIHNGQFSLVADEVAKRAFSVLQLDHVSVWRLTDDESRLHCAVVIGVDSEQQCTSFSLSEPEMRAELSELVHKSVLVRDSVNGYKPGLFFKIPPLCALGASARLDCLIGSGVNVFGVLVLQSSVPAHVWQQDQIVFAQQLADQLMLTLLNQQRLENEIRLSLAKDAAEVASRSKSEFLSSMSHELRTPLNAILGYSQLMEIDESLSGEVKLQAGEIYKAGSHMLALINDLIDMARIESGKLHLQLQDIIVSPIIKDSLKLVESMAAEYGVALVFDDLDCCDYFINVDPRRLEQILVNFLSNGIKYSRRGMGTVHIKCLWVEGKVRISVDDDGIGIPGDKQDRVFGTFERLGMECGRVLGAGLGLSITKRITEAMGGRIGFASTEGAGSTFWVEFESVEAV